MLSGDGSVICTSCRLPVIGPGFKTDRHCGASHLEGQILTDAVGGWFVLLWRKRHEARLSAKSMMQETCSASGAPQKILKPCHYYYLTQQVCRSPTQRENMLH
jgi:hypothetical protein